MKLHALLGVLVSTFVVGGMAYGNTLLLQDTYNVSVGTNDLNAELSIRQTGTLAGTAYSEKAGTATGGALPHGTAINGDPLPSGGNLRCMPAGTVGKLIWVSPNVDLLSYDNFQVSLDVFPLVYQSQLNLSYFAAISLGGAQGQGQVTGIGTGINFILHGTGAWELYDNAVLAGSGTLPGTNPNWHNAVLDWTKSGSNYFVSVMADNNQLVSGHQVQAAVTENYLTFGGFGNPTETGSLDMTIYDNLKIQTIPAPPVPEPGSLLALGMGLVGMFGIRRRSCR